jgi:hypothetical protein
MMANIGVILTEEEKQRILAKYSDPPPRRKQPLPKPKPALMTTVSEKLAAAAKANPESVRVSATAEDETVVVDRPRRSEVLEVLEVDAEGRPARARRYDTLTGEWGMVDFNQGYRQPAGAVSNYDPLAQLRGDEVDG